MSAVIPAPIPEFDWPMVIGPPQADSIATSLRAAAMNVAEAGEVASSGAVHGTWSGEAREAADHALTSVAARVENALAAMTAAVVAADEYVERLGRLERDRQDLETRQRAANREIDGLVSAHPSAGTSNAFTQRVDDVAAAAAALTVEIERWKMRVLTAEAEFADGLRAVDTVREGRAESQRSPAVQTSAALFTREVRARPESVLAVWNSLDGRQQAALLIQDPETFGNLDGIPVGARDEANRTAVIRDLDYLGVREDQGETLDDAERSRLANARLVQEASEAYRGQIDPDTGQHLLHVIGYDPEAWVGDGGVIVSLGNPDRAEHVGAYVPGTTTTTASLANNLADIRALREAAGEESTATILWLGYNAPDLSSSGGSVFSALDMTTVANAEAAAGAGRSLADFTQALRTTAEGDGAHLTLVGHSYGSTVVAEAGVEGALADDFALLGSPGAGSARTALDLTEGGEAQVWVASADHDPVSLLGGREPAPADSALGVDPAWEGFGAQRIAADDGQVAISALEDNHTSYLEGESLAGVAEIVGGGRPGTIEAREETGGAVDLVQRSAAQQWLVSPVTDRAERVVDAYDAVRDGVAGGWTVLEHQADRAGEAFVGSAQDSARQIVGSVGGTARWVTGALP